MSGEEIKLDEYISRLPNPDLPLFLIAGSVSWPPLRLSVQQMNGWQSYYAGKVNFLIVYIAEAHATDVWPLGKHVCLSSHKTLEDRMQAAKLLKTKYNCDIPILIDNMQDGFDKEYAVWPERYYVIKSGIMNHIFYPTTEFGFDHFEMMKLLAQLVAE